MLLRSLPARRVAGVPVTDLALTALLVGGVLVQVASERRLAEDGGAIAASMLTCLPVVLRQRAPLAGALCLGALTIAADVAGAEATSNGSAR